ncbi:hypothetical protein JRI60_00320 [Archangium violaceum]|uniref:hypothetical protein n=1 Tax=Archangium violaceum TaxID=83451 RepID=UPI00194FE298|nr:hypothetical protein [Archangium violaceum]QRN97575.1 hypothetical protein JRI60_00320 [Archangium violaceum]
MFEHGMCLNQAVDEDARTAPGRGLKPEDTLERFFISGEGPGSLLHQFNAHFGNVVCLKRQLPVGLFHSGKVSRATQLTPGQKSAVDVWGVSADENSVHLFELKAKGNVALGMLAEAFYYLWILSHFRMGHIGPHALSEEQPLAAVRKARQLTLWLTAPALHPLIGDAKGPVLRAFNSALQQTSAELRPLLFRGEVPDVTLLAST